MPKTGRLDIRASEEERALVARLAAHLGITQSAAIIMAVRKLARQEGISMDARQHTYTSQYWTYLLTGEHYYVTVRDDGEITECAGPLHYSDISAAKLAAGNYHSEPDDITWASERHSSEWGLLSPPYPGDDC